MTAPNAASVTPPELVFRVHGTPAPQGSKSDDVGDALRLLQACAGDVNQVTYLVIDGDPASKSRPRFGRGGRAYTPKESRAAEERTAGYLRRSFTEPHTGNVALACIFYRPNRQRIDADNMLKHVCDAANGIVWVDDSQVTSIAARVELDINRPRTLIAVAPSESSMTRGTDDLLACAVCGTKFHRGGRERAKVKTCSRECAARARGFVPLADPVPCKHCGTPFKRNTTGQKLCSAECRAANLRATRKPKQRNVSDCALCGKQLAHTRGGLCRDCWRAASPEVRAARGPISGQVA